MGMCRSPEIQYKSLGMKTEIFDPDGKSIEDTGVPGELVITRPFPSIPLCFWGDSNDEKLKEAYFNVYPGIAINRLIEQHRKTDIGQEFGDKATSL